MDKLEIMEIEIKSLRDMYKENLKRNMKSLIRDLQVELEQLEKNENYKPNSCGIVQRQGANIDELCIKLGVLDSVGNYQ